MQFCSFGRHLAHFIINCNILYLLFSKECSSFSSGEDGVLRLGVRRAAQLKNVNLIPAPHNQCSNHRNLGNVAEAVAMRTVFHIYYNPR
jgi:auxin response factor